MRKEDSKVVMRSKDFTVSNESFELVLDESLDMLITSPQPSIDNLAKYYESESYISHTDSNQSLFDKAYQFVKRFTISQKVKLIFKQIESNTSQKSILDIGCGTGDFLMACQTQGLKVFGVEPNDKATNIAQNKLEITINSDITHFTSQTFDCITMWHVLEHVPNLPEYISSLKKLLKPNGTLIVAVPNYKSFDAKYYGQFWAAFDVPRHLWHFSKTSIRLLFERENMKIVKMIPMKFDSYYVSLLSEKYKTGSSNPVKAFLVGLRSNLLALFSKEYSSIIYVIKNT